jgi:hypothetical protein
LVCLRACAFDCQPDLPQPLVGFSPEQDQSFVVCCGQHRFRDDLDMFVVPIGGKADYGLQIRCGRQSGVSSWASAYQSCCIGSCRKCNWFLAVQFPALFLSFVCEPDCANCLDCGQEDSPKTNVTKLMDNNGNTPTRVVGTNTTSYASRTAWRA